MNSLTKVLLEDLLEAEKKKVTAIYGGGFKPPTKGHYAVVEKAAEQDPEIDDIIIYVGGGERDGITQGESIQIWELYKKYLPLKTRIEPSKAPVGDVLRYAKEHPEETVLWIIGARENNPEDFTDIASRTRTIDKYPNLQLRVIQTTGGVSGTAARKAVKDNNKEQFFHLIPDIEEKEQVWDIVSSVVKEGSCGYDTDVATGKKLNTPGGLEEGRPKKKDPKKGTGKKPEGSGRRLYTDEDPKDTVRIKFKTKEDIVDTLNKTSFKAKSHARQSQVINLIHQRVRAAYGKAKDPEVKSRLKRALDYIEKRKEASKKKTERLRKMKEASDPQAGTALPYGSGFAPLKEGWNLQDAFVSLSKFMIDNGMNIKPLPKIKVIKDDKENASDLLGKTAYYDPNNKSITLFTMDRHPKDILRSFSHEMVHHEQNLNGKLNNINTTNTNEDGDLPEIEREAYEKGNIMLRNWEDTIKNV
jgi:hypothetical protein